MARPCTDTAARLGLWQHLPDDEAAAAERKAAEDHYPFGAFGDYPNDAWFFVDGESMAEGGVAQSLTQLAPRLRAHGVELQVHTVYRPVRVEDGDYVVEINGRRCVVCTPDDWAADRAWTAATVGPLAVVNDLLAEAGATPRLFTLRAGSNDAVAWLLDPRVVAAIADSGLLASRRVPALGSHD